MTMLTRALVLVVATGFVAACNSKDAPRKPEDVPVAKGAPPALDVKPLTSRDAGTSASSSPAAGAALPPGHPPLEGGPSGAAPAAAGPPVSGTVTISAKLKDRHTPGDTLFVIARSSATHQIVAVRKEQTVSFPFALKVSGADAMTSDTAFQGPFDITVRLSKSGDAMPQKGDIEGTAKGVAGGATGVTVMLDTVRQ